MNIMDGELNLLPGDRIKFINSDGIQTWDEIKEVKFLNLPKRPSVKSMSSIGGEKEVFGKVWTYVTQGGDEVPFIKIIKAETIPRSQPEFMRESEEETSTSEGLSSTNQMIKDISDGLKAIGVNDFIKVAVILAIDDDISSLALAEHLLSKRRDQLMELERASHGEKSTTKPEMA